MTTFGCVALFISAVLGFGASPAGALSPHYIRMTQQLAAGVRLGCADVDWAAAQGLIDPIEVRWLSGGGVKCPNEQYEVMLALGTKGLLACADVEWNAANGMINWNEAAGLLWRTPGCVLSPYAFLVSLSAQGSIKCVDVNWHQNQGLISAAQAGWLKGALRAQGQVCLTPFSDGLWLVGSQVTPGRYMAYSTGTCYVQRSRDYSNSFGAIITNSASYGGQNIIEFESTDVAIYSTGCGTWIPYSPPPAPASEFGPGHYVVGEQILPGRYQSTASVPASTPGYSNCWWWRLNNFGGSGSGIDPVIGGWPNGVYAGVSPTIVDILPTDRGFDSQRCGNWKRIG